MSTETPGVHCHVEVEGRAYRPREPYHFATCPRVGDTVALSSEKDVGFTERFTVKDVLHVPDGADHDRAAFTVLFVKSLNGHA